MLKTFIRTTACLAVSAAAFIVITKMDASAARRRGRPPRRPTPKDDPPKERRRRRPPAPTPPPKLTVAILEMPASTAPTTAAPPTAGSTPTARLTMPDWKGKRLSRRAARGAQAGVQRRGRRRSDETVPADMAGDLSRPPPADQAGHARPARRHRRGSSSARSRRRPKATDPMDDAIGIGLVARPLLFVALAALAFLPLEHVAAAHAQRRRRFATDLAFATVGQLLVRLGLVFAAGLGAGAPRRHRARPPAAGGHRRSTRALRRGHRRRPAAVRAGRLRLPPAGARGARAVAAARDSPFVRDDGLAGVVPAAPAGDPAA